MKPIVKILIPKAIREESYADIRSVLQSSYNGVEFVYELTENVIIPTVYGLGRNGADLGSINDNPDATSIDLFRSIKVVLNKACCEEL